MTPRPVYVVAPLGTSPAVVTETLWHLVVREGVKVLGLEIWVTTHSAAALQARVAAGLWEHLRSAAGAAADLLPPLPADVTPRAPALPDGVTVVLLRRGATALPDVRDAGDAAAVADSLHDRVRTLTTALGPGVCLVGALAGGRKTFGAALQGAFELEARPGDRLLHVLLHPRIEADREASLAYVAPTGPICGVDLDQQLDVFDVPFAPLRALLPASFWERIRGSDGSATHTWARLRRSAETAGTCQAVLEPRGRRWMLRVDDPAFELELTPGQAETYQALLAVPPERRKYVEDLAEYIQEHPTGRQRPTRNGTEQVVTLEAMYRRLADLAHATDRLREGGPGLDGFAVHGRGLHSHVPAAERVRVVVQPVRGR